MRYLLIPILILSFLSCPLYSEQTHEPEPGSSLFGKVKRVTDGDIFELEGGEKVRLIGIDCPEKTSGIAIGEGHKGYYEYDGNKAKEFTRGLIEGKEVTLEIDVQPRDKYERLLAYVGVFAPGLSPPDSGPIDQRLMIETDRGLVTFLNAVIIHAGYASPMTIPPNIKYADLFKELYEEARENKRGLWKDVAEDKSNNAATFDMVLKFNQENDRHWWTFKINEKEFETLNELKSHLKELPLGSIVRFAPTCMRWGDEPLINSQSEMEEFMKFCEDNGIIFDRIPSG